MMTRNSSYSNEVAPLGQFSKVTAFKGISTEIIARVFREETREEEDLLRTREKQGRLFKKLKSCFLPRRT